MGAQKQHWRLLERARMKHHKYYLRRGRSAAKPVKAPGDTTAEDGGVACVLGVCDAPKCTGLVMPLTKFCVRHILMQPGQCLYVPDSACTLGPPRNTRILARSVRRTLPCPVALKSG